MYAIVDIETTGGYASANGITEIAVFVHDGEKLIRHFETLINPQQPIPRYITALTGIDNRMVQDAPLFEEVAEVLHGMLKDNVFIAHSVNFDFSFVRHQLKAAGYEIPARKLCTVRLSKKVFPGLPSYSLGNLCRSLNIELENRHRAGGDARATVRLFEHMLANGAQPHIDAMLKKTSGDQWLPLNLSRSDITKLPAKPGVYYFLDASGKIIYVGKAVNIRKRVSSHFTHNEPDRKRQHFLREIHQVKCTQCATELEAIVLESAEIRRLWPRYNHSQKRPAQRFGLYCFEDNRGYLRLAIDKRKKNFPALYHFNGINEGLVLLKKMIAEFGLDEKLCYVNKTSLTESDLHSIEVPVLYNARVRQAMEALEDQLPTFAVIDQGKNEQETLCLLVERGSFWGMGYLPAGKQFSNTLDMKQYLNPYADNDTIRNSIYQFAELYPEKKLDLKKPVC